MRDLLGNLYAIFNRFLGIDQAIKLDECAQGGHMSLAFRVSNQPTVLFLNATFSNTIDVYANPMRGTLTGIKEHSMT